MNIEKLTTPAFLVDKGIVESNCSRMLKFCEKYGVKLRAQTKTHKTIEGATLQTGATKRCIVTSTLNETEFYADHGFDDILFGYVMGPQHLSRCKTLRARLKEFHVKVDNHVGVDMLVENVPPQGTKWSVFIAIDCGNKREGVWWEDVMVEELAEKLHQCPHIEFQGIYTHCGHSYTGPDVVETVIDTSTNRALTVARRIKSRGIPCPTFGVGSTPSCSRFSSKLGELTELHPGNYVFYDVQQMLLGSCKEEDIACCVATRVIGHYPRRNQMLIDCGFTALTKQGWGQMKTGYGVVKGEPNLSLCAMSQEIGYIEPLKGALEYDKYPIGKMLFIYPYHACATAAMYPVYNVCEGDQVIETWTPTRGWN